jgi:hypothetical protein
MAHVQPEELLCMGVENLGGGLRDGDTVLVVGAPGPGTSLAFHLALHVAAAVEIALYASTDSEHASRLELGRREHGGQSRVLDVWKMRGSANLDGVRIDGDGTARLQRLLPVAVDADECLLSPLAGPRRARGRAARHRECGGGRRGTAKCAEGPLSGIPRLSSGGRGKRGEGTGRRGRPEGGDA